LKQAVIDENTRIPIFNEKFGAGNRAGAAEKGKFCAKMWTFIPALEFRA